MSEPKSLTDVMMSRLKEQGIVMMPDEFVNQLILTLHMNVNAINTMSKLADIKGYSLSKELNVLSVRIADIAFSVEGVRNDQ